MDVLALTGSVVLGSLLEMGVLDHAEFLEHGQRPIDGGNVHGRHSLLDSAGHRLGRDVALGSHDVTEDGFPLGSQPASFLPEPVHDFVHALDDGAQVTAMNLHLQSPGLRPVPFRRPWPVGPPRAGAPEGSPRCRT